MSTHQFDPTHIDQLPHRMAVFPLSGTILLPRSFLPLNIFEPQYLNMIEDALKKHRYIGMVQPIPEIQYNRKSVIEKFSGKPYDPDHPPLSSMGCAGRIVRFDEESDGRFEIILRGACRFHIVEEELDPESYRICEVDYSPFKADLKSEKGESISDDAMEIWKQYFELHEIKIDWNEVAEVRAEQVFNSFSMMCPFEDMEKQALLEANTLQERAKLMTSFMEMAILNASMKQDHSKMQ